MPERKILIDEELFIDMLEVIFYPERVPIPLEAMKKRIEARALDKLKRIQAHDTFKKPPPSSL